ncbi:MAG: Lrp/AsnC family transcriptional regulator [Promethearchaeota archaeon]
MKNTKDIKIEELDIEILKILSYDGRKNKSTIAEDLKRSPNTIIKHIQNLEEEDIIKNYGVQIDFEKLGYEIIAIIEMTIDMGKMIEVERNIAQDPHIFAVYDITGEYDALLIARFKNRSDLNALIKKIHTFQYVQRTNTHLVLNIIKENDSFKKLIELDKQIK